MKWLLLRMHFHFTAQGESNKVLNFKNLNPKDYYILIFYSGMQSDVKKKKIVLNGNMIWKNLLMFNASEAIKT